MGDRVAEREAAIRRVMAEQDQEGTPDLTEDQVHRVAHLLTAGKELPATA